MRGYNLSDKPIGIKHYKYSVIAHDIREVIIKLGYKKATIIGHDWGGGITWQFLREYPGYLDRAIVLNCPPPQILLKHMLTSWTQLKKSWYMLFFQLPRLPERFMKKDPKANFEKAFRGWAHHPENFTDEDIQKYVEAFSHPYAWTAAINYYRAAFRMAFDFRWRDMRTSYCPVLLIWGEDDKALGKEMALDTPKYFLGKFEMKFIPEASHWVQNDEPELVNQYIMEFMQKEMPI